MRVEGELTDWFDIVNGLRQGCRLSPILFNVYIDHVLKVALKGYEGNVRIEFRTPDGRRARGDLCEGVMELLYADDLVIICETEKLLNEVILGFERATKAWGLNISVKKAKMLVANSDGESVATISHKWRTTGASERIRVPGKYTDRKRRKRHRNRTKNKFWLL